MVAVLDQPGLTRLVTTITGLSAVGAAAILAETGDPARYDIASTWAKHAGLCPRDNASGRFQGTPPPPGGVGLGCAPRPGGRSGACCPTTRSSPPATPT
jgi:transposase IS116/IS110/IS902 family protein